MGKNAAPERGADGKFAPRDDGERLDVRAIARAALEGKLPKETDREALDSVKPKAQAPDGSKDPAAKTASATSTDKPEQSSPEATAALAKKLEAARKALTLDGMTEDDFSKLSTERVLALGKKAAERHSDIGREKREQAAQTKAPKDPGSKKPVATPEPYSDASDSEADEIEGVIAKHFAQYAADETGFSKSMSGLARDLVNTTKGHAQKQVAEAFGALNKRFEIERAFDKVSAEFPSLETDEGRAAAMDLLQTLDESGKFDGLPMKEIVRRAAFTIWGEEKAKSAADEARAQSAAKRNGQPVSDANRAGVTKEPSAKDIARQELRRAMGTG